MKRYITFLFFLAILSLTHAQQITVHAPSNVSAGQSFKITFDINANTNDFSAPNFGKLDILSGPSTSHSSSISIVNGKRESSVRISYSYLVQAPSEGTYNVGKATCTVDGRQISSQPFTIKAVKGTAQSQPQPAGQSRGNQGPAPSRQQQAAAQSQTVNKDELYARASANKSSAYKGEEVIVTYKIYSRVDLDRVDYGKAPEKKGFWIEDLSANDQVSVKQENVGGKLYNVYTIQHEALFAQETGRLNISPFEMPARAVTYPEEPIQTPFGIIGYRRVARALDTKLRTNALSVNVKPLPDGPDNFSGAVGSFSVKGSADVTEVRANEAITFTLTVSGHGNLTLIDAPTVNFPQVFEVYDPRVEDHISRSAAGISGSRTFEWVLIPRSQGKYEIPSVDFVVFNPKTGKYETKSTQPIPVKVAKGDPNAMKSVSSKNDVKLLNSDINYIKRKGVRLGEPDQSQGILALQWFLLFMPLLGAIIAILVGRKHQTFMADEKNVRLRRATKLAKKRLRKAEQHLKDGNDDLFYEEIYKALWGCLADKYDIELSRLSRDTVEERLRDKQVAPEQHDLIMRTLNDVDFARFAPGDSASKKQTIYDEALQTIVQL